MKDKIPVVHSYRGNDMKTGQKLFEYGRLGAKSKVEKNCLGTLTLTNYRNFEMI